MKYSEGVKFWNTNFFENPPPPPPQDVIKDRSLITPVKSTSITLRVNLNWLLNLHRKNLNTYNTPICMVKNSRKN